MVKKKVEKREVDLTAMEYFLSDVFNNYLITKNHVETKINWLLGISGLIMTVCLPLILQHSPAVNHFGIIVISFTAFICFLICLISFELPDWVLKKPHADGSIMFYNTKSVTNPDEIREKLNNIKTREELFNQYSINIYNVVERNIKIKNKLFKDACNILFAGLIIGFIIILIGVWI